MAEEAATAVVAEVSVNLQDMSEKDRAEYLKTGELPGETKSDGAGEQPTAESGAAPDAAEVQESKPKEEQAPRETRSERRIRQLNDKVKQLEARLAQGTERPTESRSATVTTSKAPKWKQFETLVGTKYGDTSQAWEAYEDAVDSFHADQRKEAVAEALKAEREANQKAEAETKTQKGIEKNAKKFAERSEEYRKTLSTDNFVGHFNEVKTAIDEAMQERPEMGEIGDVLIELENGPAIINYLGAHIEELDELLDLPLRAALLSLGKLDVSDKIKTPTTKTRTAAKRIGSQVAGNGASASDPVEEAIASNDVMAYIKAMNAREAAERKR